MLTFVGRNLKNNLKRIVKRIRNLFKGIISCVEFRMRVILKRTIQAVKHKNLTLQRC